MQLSAFQLRFRLVRGSSILAAALRSWFPDLGLGLELGLQSLETGPSLLRSNLFARAASLVDLFRNFVVLRAAGRSLGLIFRRISLPLRDSER